MASLRPSAAADHTGTPASRRRHNLPAAVDSFVGRERALLDVKRWLSMTRLLTLAGTGGTGKTRLALESACDVVAAYPDGVWLVELAPLAEPALVAQAVAEVLNVRERRGRPLVDALIDRLRSTRSLIVLDNCEHLISTAAELTTELLRGCPTIAVLATSRQPLGVEGRRCGKCRRCPCRTQVGRCRRSRSSASTRFGC